MQKGSKVSGVALGATAEVKRWSAGRKKEVVLRLLRGEPGRWMPSRGRCWCRYIRSNNGAIGRWRALTQGSVSARTIRWSISSMTPAGALVNW